MLPHEGAKASNKCPCWLLEAGVNWSLKWGEGRDRSKGLLEGRLGGLPTPMVMLCAGGFCSFCILFLIFPNWACMQFLVLYSFFFFCILLLEEMFVQAQALQLWGGARVRRQTALIWCHFDFKETTEKNITQWKKIPGHKTYHAILRANGKMLPYKKMKKEPVSCNYTPASKFLFNKNNELFQSPVSLLRMSMPGPRHLEFHTGETLRSSDDGEVELWWFFSLFSMIKSA